VVVMMARHDDVDVAMTVAVAVAMDLPMAVRLVCAMAVVAVVDRVAVNDMAMSAMAVMAVMAMEPVAGLGGRGGEAEGERDGEDGFHGRVPCRILLPRAARPGLGKLGSPSSGPCVRLL